MINAPLEIDIYVHTDKSVELDKLDIEFSLKDTRLQKSTFYLINAIYPYFEDDIEVGTMILTNGTECVTPIKYNDLKDLIKKRI